MDVVELGYQQCRDLHRRHGTTYFWAAQLLPKHQRPYVHALYGFCRYADEIVDGPGWPSRAARARALAALGADFWQGWETGRSSDPIIAAVVHALGHLGTDPSTVPRFLSSMAMDLTVDHYRTWDDLLGYMDGSAAVIGEMMLPVLAPKDRAACLGPARALGIAFQLTNFLRDVGQDLGRGRVYLPREDMDRYGADPRERQVTPEWAALMRFEIARNRAIYQQADEGIALLGGRAAKCVATARVLYSRILDQVEAAGYNVFSHRARVPASQKLAVALGYLVLPPRWRTTAHTSHRRLGFSASVAPVHRLGQPQGRS